MRSGYLITGIRFSALYRIMARNRFSLFPRYVFRFLFLLQNAIWSSLFTRRDKIIWGEYFRNHPIPKDPVIIVGHWRTGSTYLHQLMNLDPQLAAPTLYQTSLPEAFITARPYYAPIMTRMIGKFRPFDNMKTGIDEPQEDEFALFRMSTESPLEKLMFPQNEKYFLMQPGIEFFPKGNKGLHWENAMLEFYRKLSWFHKKRLVLKNPFHSMRVEQLAKIFPDARFICIKRDPFEVIPSTIKMWSIVGSQNAMNRRWKAPQIEEVTGFYAIMHKQLEESLQKLPEGRVAFIEYADLTKDPVSSLRQTYSKIGLEFTESFQQEIIKIVDENRNYEKNSYSLSSEDIQIIKQKLAEYQLDATYSGSIKKTHEESIVSGN